jgi:hypothetical protein
VVLKRNRAKVAFVSTSSICEGEQVAHIWSRIFEKKIEIFFAHRPFSWSNNAAHNAGVHCIIVGLCSAPAKKRLIFDKDLSQKADSISPYLVPGRNEFIVPRAAPLSQDLKKMAAGSMPRDGGFLILSDAERKELVKSHPEANQLIRRLSGTNELINGEVRWCLWIDDADLVLANSISSIKERIRRVSAFRHESKAKTTNGYASIPHKFAQRSHQEKTAVIISKTSSELRPYIPASVSNRFSIITDSAFAVYGGGLLELSIVASKLHLVWIAAVCGKLKIDFRYSSTLGWNTFPVPPLTDNDRANLARCAEDILLAREAHFPATIADLYAPERMPADLRDAHDRNDQTLERIYIGRRFKNDTERLEKLFSMYTKLIKDEAKNSKDGQQYGRNSKNGEHTQLGDQA